MEASLPEGVSLDLNSYDVSKVTLSGTLYGADSKTDGYQSGNNGKLTISQTTSVPLLATVNGKDYVAAYADGAYTFHRVAVVPTGYQGYVAGNHAHLSVQGTFLGNKTATGLITDLGMSAKKASGDAAVSQPTGTQWYRDYTGQSPTLTDADGAKVFSFVILDYTTGVGYTNTYSVTAHAAFGGVSESSNCISRAAVNTVSLQSALDNGTAETVETEE